MILQQRRRPPSSGGDWHHARRDGAREEAYAAVGGFRGDRFDSHAEDAGGLGGQQEGAGGAGEEV